MIRFVMGLSLLCFAVGCADSGTVTADTETEAPAVAANTGGDDATTTEEPAADTNVAATEEPAVDAPASQDAELVTVKFKVPGMT